MNDYPNQEYHSVSKKNTETPGTAGQIPSADNRIQIDNTIQTGSISHDDGHTSQTGSASHTGDNPTQTSQPWVFTPATPAAPQPPGRP